MHEFSMAEELLSIVRTNAAASNAKKVTSIRVRLSGISSITADALSFSFDAVSRGTICEGASLIIERVPVIVRCKRCNLESEIQIPKDIAGRFDEERHHLHHVSPALLLKRDVEFICNMCGCKDFDLIDDDEIYLDRIELDV